MRIDEQGRRIEEQIDLGNRQAKTAEDQAKSAKDSANSAINLYRESVRSRVDQNAPEVVVYLELPEPPLMDAQRTGMPQRNDLRLLDTESFKRAQAAAGEEFVFDGDRNVFLWFHGRGELVNEGRTNARARLDNMEGRFVSGDSPLAADDRIEPPRTEQDTLNSVAILPPGGHALFEWAAGHTVGEWADAHDKWSTPTPQGSIWFWITVFDARDAGVIDTQMMHFRPEVIRPVPARNGHWKVASSQNFGPVHSLPRRRGYRHEGASTEDSSQMNEYYQLASGE